MISGLATKQRSLVVGEARKWIGTPYHACADVKGAGVDCGMLLVRVFVDVGLLTPFDPRPYVEDWHLHRSEELCLGFVRDRCREVPRPLPGDLALFRYGRCYSHGAIVTYSDPISILHAFQPAGIVLEETLAENAALAEAARRPRYFSLWTEANE